jgi:hypothetical protein
MSSKFRNVLPQSRRLCGAGSQFRDMDKRASRNYQYGLGTRSAMRPVLASSWPSEFDVGEYHIAIASPGYA